MYQELSVISNLHSEITYSDTENMQDNFSYAMWYYMTNKKSYAKQLLEKEEGRGKGKEVQPESEQNICTSFI